MNEFNQLWDEVSIMVDFEANRIKNSSGKVNVQQIENYYKIEIIDKLWFNFTFPNKYNKWVCDYYREKPAVQQAIRKEMDHFSPASRGKRSIGLLATGIVILILGLLSYAIPDIKNVVPLGLTLIGIGLTIGGTVKNGNSRKYCDMASLTGELNRIKNQVNTLIHEHANI